MARVGMAGMSIFAVKKSLLARAAISIPSIDPRATSFDSVVVPISPAPKQHQAVKGLAPNSPEGSFS
jgi:hypothetical protein